jgi:hypothetical protein
MDIGIGASLSQLTRVRSSASKPKGENTAWFRGTSGHSCCTSPVRMKALIEEPRQLIARLFICGEVPLMYQVALSPFLWNSMLVLISAGSRRVESDAQAGEQLDLHVFVLQLGLAHRVLQEGQDVALDLVVLDDLERAHLQPFVVRAIRPWTACRPARSRRSRPRAPWRPPSRPARPRGRWAGSSTGRCCGRCRSASRCG